MSHTLPPGWTESPLKDLGLIKPQGIRPDETPKEHFELWSVPSYPTNSPETLLGKEIGSNKIVVLPGDVLLCKINPRINRVWYVRPSDTLQQIASTEWIVFRTGYLDSRFFMYRLQEQSFRNKICSNVSGVGGSLTRARPKEVKEIKISIPPLPEQKRIAAKISTLQAKSRKAKEALEAARPLLDKLRQSILAAAFRGDLTADWRKQNPDVEPAAKLLERIRIERRQKWEEAELAKMRAKGKEPKNDKWKGRYKEPEPVDTTDLPELPEGWCWEKVDTIAFVTKLAGFEYSKFVQYHPGGDLPVIKAENAGKQGFKVTEFSFVESKAVKNLTRSEIFGGEVLMVFVGAGVGQVALVPKDKKYFLGPNIAIIRPQTVRVIPEFLELFFRSPVGFRLTMSFTKAVAQPSLSMKTIRQIPIAIPPIQEQLVIIAKIAQLNSTQLQVDKNISQLLTKVGQLDQSILAKAFRGELVPQDPNDEPASVLLERIKAEREAAKPRKKTRKKKQPGKSK